MKNKLGRKKCCPDSGWVAYGVLVKKSPTDRGWKIMSMVFPSKHNDQIPPQWQKVCLRWQGQGKICCSVILQNTRCQGLVPWSFSPSAWWLVSFPGQLFFWSLGDSWEAITMVAMQISWYQDGDYQNHILLCYMRSNHTNRFKIILGVWG